MAVPSLAGLDGHERAEGARASPSPLSIAGPCTTHRPCSRVTPSRGRRSAAQSAIVGASKSVARGQLDTVPLADALEHADGDEGLAPEFEEVVVNAHLGDAEEISPDARELPLDGVSRSDERRVQTRRA